VGSGRLRSPIRCGLENSSNDHFMANYFIIPNCIVGLFVLYTPRNL